MTRGSWLLPCLLLAACGGGDEATTTNGGEPGTGTERAAVEIDVATVRTVGDPPPAESRLDIAVDGTGALHVNGAPSDLAGLAAELQRLADAERDEETLDVDVVLVLDRSLPWRVAQIVLQECASARIARVFFSVRHVRDGELGALAAYFPRDVAVMPPKKHAMPKIGVRVRTDGPPNDPRGLETIAAGFAQDLTSVVELDGGPTAPVELMLALIDAAAIGGADELVFTGTPYVRDETSLPDEVESLRQDVPARTMQVINGTWPVAPSGDVDAPRVRGAYAGFHRHPLSPTEAEEIELVEPDEE